MCGTKFYIGGILGKRVGFPKKVGYGSLGNYNLVVAVSVH